MHTHVSSPHGRIVWDSKNNKGSCHKTQLKNSSELKDFLLKHGALQSSNNYRIKLPAIMYLEFPFHKNPTSSLFLIPFMFCWQYFFLFLSVCLYFRQECPRLCAQAPCSPLPVASAPIWPVLSLKRRRMLHRRAQGQGLPWLMDHRSPPPPWTPWSRTWSPLLITTPR